MSRSIDEKVVEMRFDNSNFEKNVNKSMSTLDKLKQALDRDVEFKGLQAVGGAIEQLSVKFSTLQMVATGVLTNIANTAINTTANAIKSVTIDQATTGFDKYNTMLTSTQTIMNATGESLEEVQKQMDKLMWFTDETSYDFGTMISTLSTFTAAGIDLESGVTDMIGIANWAATAGVNAREATSAFYALSKAVGEGQFMGIQTWDTISQTVHMNTPKFVELAIQKALELGTLQLNKAGKAVVKGINKEVLVDAASFRSTLSERWLTGEVLESVLDVYGNYTGVLYDMYQSFDGEKLTSEIISDIEKSGEAIDNFGLEAFKAGQQTRTLVDVFDYFKTSSASAWQKVFTSIFGEYDEAVKLFSSMSDQLWDLIVGPMDAMSTVFNEWKNLGGRDLLFGSINEEAEESDSVFWSLVHTFTAVTDAIKEGIGEIFDPITAKTLIGLTKRLHAFVNSLTPSEETLDKIRRLSAGIAAIFKMVQRFSGAVFRVVKTIAKSLFGIDFDDFLEFLAETGDWLVGLNEKLKGGKRFEQFLANVEELFTAVGKAGREMAADLGGFVSDVFEKIFAAKPDDNRTILDRILDAANGLFEWLKKVGFLDFIAGIPSMIRKVYAFIQDVGLIDFIVSLAKALGEVPGLLIELAKIALPLIIDIAKSLLKLLPKLLPIIEPLIKGILSFLTGLIDGVVNNQEGITGFFEEVGKALGEFGTWLGDIIASIDFTKVTEWFAAVKDAIVNVFTAINWSEAWGGVKNFFNGIKDTFTNVDSEALKGFLDVLKKILEVLKEVSGPIIGLIVAISFAKLASGFRNFGKGFKLIGDAIDSIPAGIYYHLLFRGISEVIYSVIALVLSISAALLVLSFIPTEKLKTVATVMGIVIGVLTLVLSTVMVFVAILSKMAIKPALGNNEVKEIVKYTKGKYRSDQSNVVQVIYGVAKIISAISFAIIALAASAFIISKIGNGNISLINASASYLQMLMGGLMFIIAVVLGLVLAIVAVAKGKSDLHAGNTMLGVSKILDSVAKLVRVMITAVAVFAIIAGIMVATSKGDMSKLMAAAQVLAKLSNIITVFVAVTLGIMTVLVGVMGHYTITGIAYDSISKNINAISLMMLAFAGSIVILIFAVKELVALDPDKLRQGIKAVAVIAAILVLMIMFMSRQITVLRKNDKVKSLALFVEDKTNDLIKMATAMLLVSAAMMAVALVVGFLTILNPNVLWSAILAFATLTAFMTLMIFWMSKMENADRAIKGATAIMLMAVAMSMVLGSILGFITSAFLILANAEIVNAITGGDHSVAMKRLATIIGVVILIFAALTVLMTGMTVWLGQIKKIDAVYAGILAIATIGAVMAALAEIIVYLVKNYDEKMLQIAIGMLVFIAELFLGMIFLGKLAKPKTLANLGMASVFMLAVAASMIGLAAAAIVLSKIPKTAFTGIAIAMGVGLFLLLAGAVLVGKLAKPKTLASLGMAAVFVLSVAAAMAGIAAAALIMAQVPSDKVVGVAVTLGIMLAEVLAGAVLIGKLAKPKTLASLGMASVFVLSIAAALVVFAAAAKIASDVPLGILITLTVVLGLILAGTIIIGALGDKIAAGLAIAALFLIVLAGVIAAICASLVLLLKGIAEAFKLFAEAIKMAGELKEDDFKNVLKILGIIAAIFVGIALLSGVIIVTAALLIVLGAAFIVLGLGALFIAVPAIIFAKAIDLIVESMDKAIEMGTKGVEALTGFADMLKEFLQIVMDSLIDISDEIGRFIARVIISAILWLITGLEELFPYLVKFNDILLDYIGEFARVTVAFFATVIEESLWALGDHMQGIVMAFNYCLAQFFIGVMASIALFVPMVVDAGIMCIIAFIYGMANAIFDHSAELAEAVHYLAMSVLATVWNVFFGAQMFATGGKSGALLIKRDPNSPAYKTGQNYISNLAAGLSDEKGIKSIADVAETVGKGIAKLFNFNLGRTDKTEEDTKKADAESKKIKDTMASDAKTYYQAGISTGQAYADGMTQGYIAGGKKFSAVAYDQHNTFMSEEQKRQKEIEDAKKSLWDALFGGDDDVDKSKVTSLFDQFSLDNVKKMLGIGEEGENGFDIGSWFNLDEIKKKLGFGENKEGEEGNGLFAALGLGSLLDFMNGENGNGINLGVSPVLDTTSFDNGWLSRMSEDINKTMYVDAYSSIPDSNDALSNSQDSLASKIDDLRDAVDWNTAAVNTSTQQMPDKMIKALEGVEVTLDGDKAGKFIRTVVVNDLYK